MNHDMEILWSVTELNQFVKELLASTVLPFWLHGEISNLTIHAKGHVYLTLKDSSSQIAAVMWMGAEQFRRLGIVNGQEIDVFGSLSVYEPRGTYQLIISQFRVGNLGHLKERFELLKRKLAAEGAFDINSRRPLPKFPLRVGLVTSLEGAAIHDFLSIAYRRFPNLTTFIYPVSVQGKFATDEISLAIAALNLHQQCEIIIITRGGGSEEDLQAFNDEKVARAIINSKIPVISAVGHEIDTTIADLVADLRVPTPSAAAEISTSHWVELQKQLHQFSKRLNSSFLFLYQKKKYELSQLSHRPILKNPLNLLSHSKLQLNLLTQQLTQETKEILTSKRHLFHQLMFRLQSLAPLQSLKMQQQHLEQLSIRLQKQMTTSLSLHQQHLESLSLQLNQLSPTQVLKRGYAILRKPNGQIVQSIQQLCLHEPLVAKIVDGDFEVEIKNI